MNLLKRLFGLGGGQRARGDSEANALIYYVRGRKCGAITRVRIDTRNELSRDENDQFFVRKVIVDSECYGQVEIKLGFDAQHRETSREINGGEFVDHAAYEAYQSRRNLKKP
jgi:hypothetical protein